MARMHARRKGSSGSTRPAKRENMKWVEHKPAEITKLVLKLANQDMQTSQIGLNLRDSYGVPDVKAATGQSISQILKEAKIVSEVPEDLQNLIKRAIQIRKHLEQNKKDNVSKRGLHLTESKIRRLEKYYKRTGRIAVTWKYDPKRARLLVG